MLNRRRFNQGLLGLGILAASQVHAHPGEHKEHQYIASAARDPEGQHWLHILTAEGEAKHSFALPARAHQVIFHNRQPWVVVTARRPGHYLWIANYLNGEILYKITPEAGYHFYGHAAFSADGQKLFTTENHMASGQGKVFVRDLSANGQVIQRFESYGIGPHQLALMPDQQSLVIANGGILTRGRDKLNLETMEPSLAYIRLSDGHLLEQVRLAPEYHQLSIRHLDVNDQGQVAIALQYQGSPFDRVPLVASHRRGEALQPLWAPEQVNQAMKHYAGSACFDRSGRFAMISSPKGNLVTLWDMAKAEYVDQIRCRDGCGLASASAGEFLISNGVGKIYRYDMLSGQKKAISLSLPQRQSWDNHMSVINV